MPKHPRSTHSRPLRTALLGTGTALGLSMAPLAAGHAAGPITVGFIVKTLSNPYFAAMHKAAEAEAQKTGVHLIFEAGKYDGDVTTQISDIEDLTTHGANAIIIVPNVSSSLATALERAKKAGITVIAVTPPSNRPVRPIVSWRPITSKGAFRTASGPRRRWGARSRWWLCWRARPLRR